MSPHALAQEYLNRSEDHLWAIVSNGLLLRMLRDNASLTRAAYLEFDLAAIFDGEAYSDFVMLWMVCHRSRFEGDPPEKCLLEQWSTEAAAAGTRALDRLRVGVENAIVSLGEGFLAARQNAALRQRIRSGALEGDEFLRQLLRIVYRMLFLLVAESKDLVLDPAADETARIRYRRFYSVDRLRFLAQGRRGTAHGDLWRGLIITMKALDARHPGIPELGLVPLGSFLWSPDSVPDLVDASIENRHLLAAVRHLTLVRDAEAKAYRAVDYRNLGPRELGSVFESLLELHPEMNVEARSFVLASARGNERKTSGSFYTPSALIERLLDEALDPILDEAEGSADPEKSLLDLRVLDPACGSGHFLVEAAHRIAGRLATHRAGGVEPAPAELQAALRDVVGRCLYGIDINPMAVELCKVSLWLVANTPGRPLGFIDHHIVCGNSLLGTTPALLENGLPNEAFKALTGDDKKRVNELRKTNRAERKQRDQGLLPLGWSPRDDVAALAKEMEILDSRAGETAVDEAVKKELHGHIQRSDTYMRSKLVADAWCAAFVNPKKQGEPVITDSTVRAIGEGHEVGRDVVKRVQQLADHYKFLHLHLVFPDVEERGGFDAVLGNPPWEKVKLLQKEWFAAREPEIAAARNKAARLKLIEQLRHNDPALYEAFQAATRQAEGISSTIRNSSRYPLCGRGDVNTYAVFAELMRNSVADTGRTGMIVPSGIATDFTYRQFFSDLVDKRSLASLYDFENRQKIFPGIDSRIKFCLLTLGGAEVMSAQARFAFFLQRPEEAADPDRAFPMSREDFALFNPNTRTCPVFRTRKDMETARKMYERAGVVWRETRDGKPKSNPWGVSFSTMFHMSNDSSLFRTRDHMEEDGWEIRGNSFVKGEEVYLPLYEAKLFHQYDHRFATFEGASPKEIRTGKARPMTPEEKADPGAVSLPRYWIPRREVKQRSVAHFDTSTLRHFDTSTLRHAGTLGAKLALRQVTNSTNERTSILSMIPIVGLGHSGAIISVGGWPSETSRDQRISEPRSSRSSPGSR